MPYGTDVESKRKLIVDYKIVEKLLQNEKDKKTLRSKILKVLSEKDEISFSYLQKSVKKKNIYSVVRSLEKEGALVTLNEIGDAKVRIKKAKYVKLAKPVSEVYEFIPEIESRSPKQVSILLELISKRKKNVKQSDLLKKTGASQSSIQSLEEKGMSYYYLKKKLKEDFLKVFLKNILSLIFQRIKKKQLVRWKNF